MANITETYRTHAKLHYHKIAVQTVKKKISYIEWYELISKTANWLNSLEVENKVLGIHLPNGIAFLQFFTGASMAGWTAVPIDLKWKENELFSRITLSNPSIIISTKEIFTQHHPQLPNLLMLEDCLLQIDGMSNEFLEQTKGDLPFYIGFTSGTTGNPKAFGRSQKSWVASFECNRYDLQIDSSDHVLIPGSLIHSHFLYGAVSTLYLGGTVFLMEKFSSKEMISCIRSNPISTIYTVPTMIEAIVEETVVEKPLKVLSSGAKWSKESKQKIRKTFPQLTMYEFYGSSELSFVTVLSNKDGIQKSSSVGQPCYGVELQIRRTNNEMAKVYEPGKIFVRSELFINGYLDKSNRISQPFRDGDGWATVHDIGYMDEDGFLYIVGREESMILYGGINIFPEEIEKIIALHAEVDEVAVVGFPNKYWGQIVAAVVKGRVTSLELKRLCKIHLASYKIPRRWFFLEEIPYTTSGKIARAEILKKLKDGE